ncbi:uncharacterized protein G2W53_028783 [Senna tora]|uniref:Uncharacterized protein n=1 Tax=Senna tora TaxID=362788 RepID=A0A834TCW2_9FABA|nr:uncharacterized protein G2W53_028783 [Senna tora]
MDTDPKPIPTFPFYKRRRFAVRTIVKNKSSSEGNENSLRDDPTPHFNDAISEEVNKPSSYSPLSDN